MSGWPVCGAEGRGSLQLRAMSERSVLANEAHNPAIPEPRRHLRGLDVPAIETEDIRINAEPDEAARLMRSILSLHRFDAALNEEDGHCHIDVRNGDGVVGAIIDLVASAIDEEQLAFATVCIGKRTLSFYPLSPADSSALAA